MPLPSAPNQLTLDAVATEFGDSTPHSLTEFVRGGPRVENTPINSNISSSTSGLRLSQFYAASSVYFSSWNIAGDLNFRVQGPASTWGTLDQEITANLTKANDTGGDISFNLLVEVNGSYEDTLGDLIIPNGQSSGSLTYPVIIDGGSEPGGGPVKLQGAYGESDPIVLNFYECKYKFEFEYQIAGLEHQYTGFFNYRQRFFKGYLWTGSFKAAIRECTTFACDEYVQETITTWSEATTNNSFGSQGFSSTRTEQQVFAAFGVSDFYNDADCRSTSASRAGDCSPNPGIYYVRSKYLGRTSNFRDEVNCTPVSGVISDQACNGFGLCGCQTSFTKADCDAFFTDCRNCPDNCTTTQVFDGYTYTYEILFNTATSSSTTQDTDECKTFSTTNCETFGDWTDFNTTTLYTDAGYSANTPDKLYMTEDQSIIGEGFAGFETTACKSTNIDDAINCDAGLQTVGQDPSYPNSQFGVYNINAVQGDKVYTDWTGTLSFNIVQSADYYTSEDDYLNTHDDGAYASFNTENCKSSTFVTTCEGNDYPTDTANALQQEFWNVQGSKVLSTERQSPDIETITAISGDGGDGGDTEYITHVEGVPILQAITAVPDYVDGSATLTSATAPSPNTNNSNCPTTGELEG